MPDTYISPGLQLPNPYLPWDKYFPHMTVGDPRWVISPERPTPPDPHTWYHNSGSNEAWLNTDEAAILYNNARQFSNKRAIEIGSASGFSSWHILAGGMQLHTCDIIFNNNHSLRACANSLKDFSGRFSFHATPGHIIAPELGRQYGPWSLVLIDGNHNSPYTAMDALACAAFCAPNAMIFLHDLCYEGPREAQRCLDALGWYCITYQTSRRLGVCWRGNVEPVKHIPDPAIAELIQRSWSSSSDC